MPNDETQVKQMGLFGPGFKNLYSQLYTELIKVKAGLSSALYSYMDLLGELDVRKPLISRN